MGMIYDEFAMKRIGGLRRQIENNEQEPGRDGLTPVQELQACRQELYAQTRTVARLVQQELRPALAAAGIPIRDMAELTAREFAGVVRLQVSADMPEELQHWLATQLNADPLDSQPTDGLLGLADLMKLPVDGHPELRDPPHEPVTHPRLRYLDSSDTSAIFAEICRADILVHLPYHSFDTSILRFLQSAVADPSVLAIKPTIYRTSSQSPNHSGPDGGGAPRQAGGGGDHRAFR